MRNTTARREGGTTVAYVRVASVYQRDGRLGVKRQLQACEDYAHSLGEQLSRIYVDQGASGLRERRPALDELMRDLSHGHIRRVVMTDPARLARSASLERQLSQLIRRHGATVTCACDGQENY